MKKKKLKFKIDVSLLYNPAIKKKDTVGYKIDKHTKMFDIIKVDKGLQLRIVVLCILFILFLI